MAGASAGICVEGQEDEGRRGGGRGGGGSAPRLVAPVVSMMRINSAVAASRSTAIILSGSRHKERIKAEKLAHYKDASLGEWSVRPSRRPA